MSILKPKLHTCGYVAGVWRVNADHPFSKPLPFDSRQSGAEFGGANHALLQEALVSARSAASSWAAMAATQRAALLTKAADLIDEQASALLEIMAKEAGKPLAEARAEVAAASGLLRTFAGWVAWGNQGSIKRNGKLRVIQEKYPRGVAAIITPWNYPLSNPCQKLGAALIGGNTVIWRPSAATPETSCALASIFHDAGMPAGVFQMLVEGGDQISRALVASDGIDAVSFTGSTRVGQQVAVISATRGVPAQCEMGGKNAVVVLADADIDMAAERIAYGAFGFAGQKCTAVSRLLVQREAYPALIDRIKTASKVFRPGLPHVSETCLAPLISAEQKTALLSQLDEATTRGVRILHGGVEVKDAPFCYGNYLTPTIAAVSKVDDPLWAEECFGPILAVQDFDSLEQAIHLVNGSRYGLGAALFTNDATCISMFSREVEVGVIKINDVPPGLFPYVSAGGWKSSGTGLNELSEDGVDFFMHKKSVYLP